MKSIIAVIVITLILPVHGEQKSPKPTGDQKPVQSVDKPSPPASHIIAIEQEHPADQGNGPKKHSKKYLYELLSANNLPSLLLFFAGLGGIAVGVYTLKDIRRQTGLLGQYVEATKNSVIATQHSAEAMRKNVELQEVNLRQWVDIENWKTVPWMPEGGEMSLHVQFDVVNPTNLSLTLNSVFIMLGEEGSKVGRKNLIPPKKSQPVVTSVKITEEQALKWEDLKELVFIVNGYVDFDDVLKRPQNQPFSGLIACSKKGGVRFIPPYGSGLYITDNEKNSGDPN